MLTILLCKRTLARTHVLRFLPWPYLEAPLYFVSRISWYQKNGASLVLRDIRIGLRLNL